MQRDTDAVHAKGKHTASDMAGTQSVTQNLFHLRCSEFRLEII